VIKYVLYLYGVEIALKVREKDKYYIFPHITGSILLHCLIVIIYIVSMIILGKEQEHVFRAIRTVCSIVIPVVFLTCFLLLNVFFWNAVVRIDSQGMHQRCGLRIFSWNWDEIKDVQCKTKRPWPLNTSAAAIYSPKFIFISSAHNKRLSVVMEKYTRKVFSAKCPMETVKEKYEQLLKKCDFMYF